MTDLGDGTDELPPTDAILITGPSVKVVVAAVGNRAQTQVLPRGAGPPVRGHRPRRGPTGRAAALGRLSAEMSSLLGL